MIPLSPMGGACVRLRAWLACVLVGSTFAHPSRAEHDGQALNWDLITIGPDTDLFSLWGHTALCASSGKLEDGTCFDFGIAIETDPAKLAIGTLRGDELFAVVRVPARVLLGSSQFRDAWQQRIQLDAERGRELLAELEHAVETGASYAYQPLERNCTSEIRDRLDRALAGALAQGAHERAGAPRRQAAESGLSGRLLPLTLLALAGGSALDRPASAWERMALPDGLMQAVAERLSAAPSRLSTRVDAPPPTSPHAGRILLSLLTLLVSWLSWRRLRRAPDSHGVRIALAVWLTGLACFPVLGVLSTLPSLQQNWMVLVLCPLDALLAFGRRPTRWQRVYALVRLTLIVLLGVASAFGLVAQSLWVGVLAAGIPIGLWFLAQRRARHG